MTPVSPLEIGIDVPWVTSWSEEPQLGVSRCPSVDGQLAIAQQINPGAGQPLYARNHLFRQRKSVREMRCPMCGELTREDDRWSQIAEPTTAGALRAKGFGPVLPTAMPDTRPLLNCGVIAPLHLACAQAALAGCPHLGQMSDRELKRFPKSWVVAPIWIEARPPLPQTKSVAVVSFLQLIGVEDEDVRGAPGSQST